MYFGEYLVQKKIISDDQLLNVLCFQLESLPSIIRLIWDAGIINSSELLNLIKSQVQSDTDIISILLKENKISRDKMNELELLQVSKKVPLGEAVVKLKFASVSAVNEALKEYYDNKFHLQNTVSAPSVEKTTIKEEVQMNSAALESLKELGMTLDQKAESPNVLHNFSPKQFVDQYVDLFTEKYKNKIKKLIDILITEVEGSSDISNYFNSLYRDLHLLKGSIVLAELKSQEEIISIWEYQIERVLTKSNDEIRLWCKNSLDLLKITLDFLWKSKNKIAIDRTDEGIMNDDEYCDELNSLIDKISI